MRTRRQILFAVLMVLVSACSVQKRNVPAPAAIVVAEGDEFDVRLPANPGTGFRWQVGHLDERVVRLVDTRYEPDDPQPLGAGGTTIFSFVGVAKGRGRIELVYVRSWEKGVAPARTADYSVEVR